MDKACSTHGSDGNFWQKGNKKTWRITFRITWFLDFVHLSKFLEYWAMDSVQKPNNFEWNLEAFFISKQLINNQ
jgi:hypothetical protein